MTRIAANPTVQQELQSRGVTAEVGVFGEHQVQIGKSKPVKLDNIRSASIPFAGFRSATRIASGVAGVNRTAAAALRALTRPGGKLDAGELLSNLKGMRTHLQRLDALGRLKEPRADAPLRAYAQFVEHMSNEELAAVYQSFVSAEMDLVQSALGYEGRVKGSADSKAAASDLFDIQALVLKEVSDRVARGEHMPGAEDLPPLSVSMGALTTDDVRAPAKPDHISHANLRTMVEVGAQGATTREKMTGEFQQDIAARGLPSSLSARAMGDVLRSAELTMNIDQDFLFRDSSIMREPDTHVQNFYHLQQAGVTFPRTYKAPRTAVENALFPELAGHDINPDERPVYGALNVNRRSDGSAKMYGDAIVVFKPEVAQRATYVVGDSFYGLPVSMSRERRDNFYARLQNLGGDKLPAAVIQGANQADSPIRKKFEEFFDMVEANGSKSSSFNLKDNCPNGELMDAMQASYLHAEMVGAFVDPSVVRARTATYDSLEALIPGMSTPTLGSFARAAIHDGPASTVGLRGAGYIEAQIQGGVVPSRDIKEIRINTRAFDNPAALQQARAKADAFTQRTNIPVIFMDTTVIPQSAQEGRIDAATKASGDFAIAHLNRDTLHAQALALAQNPRSMLERMIKDDTSLQALPLGIKNIQGDALQTALGKFQELVQDWSDHPERRPKDADSLMTEQGMVERAFKETLTPVLKNEGAILLGAFLQEVENLDFSTPEQKEAFSKWVHSGVRNLNSPQELRTVLESANRQAEKLRVLATADPAPTPGQLLQEFSSMVPEGANPIKLSNLSNIPSDPYHLSLAMLRHAPGGAEALNKLADRLNSPEQLQLSGQLVRLVDAGGEFSALEGFAALSSAHHLLKFTRNNLNKEGGSRTTLPTPFIGELSLLPSTTRSAVGSIAPALAQHLEAAYPAYLAFPTPAQPGLLPQTDADRRNFLVRHLDVYTGHEQTFEKTTATHGRGHIARAYIFASAMCNIMAEQGVAVDRNAVLCGIAGHDMGRKGTGKDIWEAESAAMLVGAMRQDFNDSSMGQEYEKAVCDCITHGSKTLEGHLLTAADSLDIGRTKDFDPERFAFLQGQTIAGKREDTGPDAGHMREQLAREADLLQRLTNPSSTARPAVNHLTKMASESSYDLATVQNYMEQVEVIKAGVAAAYANRWNEPSESYLSSVEKAIHLNKDLFPLLNKYYPEAAPTQGEPHAL